MTRTTLPAGVYKTRSLTKALIADLQYVRVVSASGASFTISDKHSHWGGTYECLNVTQGTKYYVNSLADVREWLSLN